jgi:hypothetical protein
MTSDRSARTFYPSLLQNGKCCWYVLFLESFDDELLKISLSFSSLRVMDDDDPNVWCLSDLGYGLVFWERAVGRVFDSDKVVR